MAIAATNILQNFNNSALNSYSTASASPTTGRLQLLLVGSQVSSGTSQPPTVTGAGLTWVQVATALSSDNLRRATLFRAMGTASTGALTMDYAGVNQVRTGWSWSEFSGVNTGGTNGSAAIIQSATATVTNTPATGVTVTLAAFADANNATYGCLRYGNGSTTDAVTEGSGFTRLGLVDGGNASYGSMYKLTNDTTVDWTWNSGSFFSQAIAVEIGVAAAAATGTASRKGLLGVGI